LRIFNSGGGQQFSDSFTGNTSPPADYYAIKLTYHSTGTTMDIMGDTVYKQGLGVTGPGPPPAYDLTLTNPTNAGGYTPTNLPLPNATTINNFFVTAGHLGWDPDGQSFDAIITEFNGQAVPEPSSIVMGSLAIVACAAGTFFRRRH
jgi:hypothetical protein